jgi:hypothetical protein
MYSGRKIIESLGNVTVRGERRWKEQGGARWPTVSLSTYSITENIYYSQLSSVAILLQPESNCFTSYNTMKWLCSVSLCAIALRSPPASHVSTSNGQWSSQLFYVYYTANTNFRSAWTWVTDNHRCAESLRYVGVLREAELRLAACRPNKKHRPGIIPATKSE